MSANDSESVLAGQQALHLRTILESMEEGVIVQAQDGTVVSTNAAARRILQVTVQYLESQPANGPSVVPLVRRDGTPLPDEERPSVRVLKTGLAVTNAVMGLRRSDGATTWVSTNATPLRDSANGPLQGAVLTFRDITAQVELQDSLEEAELALAKSEQSFRTLTDRAPIGIGVREGPLLVFVNPALCRILGASSEAELVGRSVLDFAPQQSLEIVRNRVEKSADGSRLNRQIFSAKRQDGAEILLEVESLNIEFHGKLATMSLLRDVTELERTKAERDAAHAALTESLGQKETLLQEIHHRVKNNLQVIASLLRLGRRYVMDVDAQSVFDDSIARVHSISLIHERLYQSRDLDRIEMATYLDGLTAEVTRANTIGARAQVKVVCDRLFFDMDRCIPIGLIVNELLSNSLKHGFPDGAGPATPTVIVSLSESPLEYELAVRDNGRGLDEEIAREGSLGLRLVSGLVKQLRGQHRLERGVGTAWHIVFPKAGTTTGDDA